MHVDAAYRLLDVEPGTSDEDIKRAHRDLTKVWHPDRFGNDAALRQKAEEKLKAINDAYETIRASREGRWSRGFARDNATSSGTAEPSGLRRSAGRNRNWAITCALIATFILLRRPTPGGLAIAIILFCLAFVFIRRMRTEE